MSDLDARLSRLEAVEAVRGVFAQYVQLMDAGAVDDLMALFETDAELLASNEPAGTGGTVSKKGRDDIESHYRPLPYGTFRHHTTNTTIDVSADATHAELSSYFLTAKPSGIKGGLYEASLFLAGEQTWRIRRLQITSSWGWGISDSDARFFAPLGDLTLRGGRPVVWNETIRTADIGG